MKFELDFDVSSGGLVADEAVNQRSETFYVLSVTELTVCEKLSGASRYRSRRVRAQAKWKACPLW